MLATLYTFLVERDVAGAQVLAPMLTIAGIVLIAAVLYVVLRQVVVRLISRLAERTRTQWDKQSKNYELMDDYSVWFVNNR